MIIVRVLTQSNIYGWLTSYYGEALRQFIVYDLLVFSYMVIGKLQSLFIIKSHCCRDSNLLFLPNMIMGERKYLTAEDDESFRFQE